MRQIRQSRRTRLQVVCLTYIYLRDQRDKGFRSYNIEDKMNKELLSELETQGHLLETMMPEMETFKGPSLLLVEGNNPSRWCVSIVACQGCLICHPTKLKPPAQIHKCCGFLYNSVGTPKLRIPDKKVVRDLALLELLMRGSRTVICRLALAVVVGNLQSLVPATPNAIGASFLHHVYRNIHNETLEFFDDIHDFYHSGFALGALAQADLSWWEQALASGLREQVQPRDLCTLGVAWGDGRGSGSGGTFEWVESGKGVLPIMEA
jgi:hypothetical protein